MTVDLPLPTTPTEQPIERPGVTIRKSLAELLGLDGETATEVEWQARMRSIAEAEARAWAARDLHKIGQFEGIRCGIHHCIRSRT